MKRFSNTGVWVAMFLAIAVLAYQFSDQLLIGAGSLEVSEEGVPGNTIVFAWRGEIGPPMASEIHKAFRKWGGKKERIVLTLHSPGGLLGHGDRVVRQLQRIARTHELETVVARRRTCASMCVPIYLQGERRYAAANSRWLFHEPSAVDVLTDERQPSTAAETERKTRVFLLRYFPQAGVPAFWLKHTREKMRGRDYWRTGRQLVEERSGIIHELLP